jgi:hypothetical protein
MSHPARTALAVLAVLTSGTLTSAMNIRSADTRDSLQQGLDALSQKKFYLATQKLEAAGATDPRVKKALREARIGLARECTQTGRAAEAADLYLALSEDAADYKETKDTYVKAASQLLTTAFADAQKKKAHDKLLEIAAAWQKHFPDKPALLTDADAANARLDLVIALCDDKFNQLTLPDLLKRLYPDGQVPWEELAKKNRGVPLLALHFKALAEIGWAGRYIAEYKNLDADSPVRGDKNFAAQTERMFVRRAEAAALQGNVYETRKAIAAAKTEVTSSAGSSTLRNIESKLPPDVGDALGGGGGGERKLRDLTFTEPLKGKVTWSDRGEGLGEAQNVILDDGCELIIAAGTTLNGGKINLRQARLKIAGEPNRPVILRNLSIDVDAGGEVDGQNVILENCTFARSKDALVLYASKWSFNNAIFYRSRFRSLSRGSYGLKITNTAFVECELPARYAGFDDLLGSYSGMWETVQNNLFLRCNLYFSLIWVSKNCNFAGCTFSPEEFSSKTPIISPVHLPAGDPQIQALAFRSIEPDIARVQYQFSPRPHPANVPATLWALLPVDTPSDANGGARPAPVRRILVQPRD